MSRFTALAVALAIVGTGATSASSAAAAEGPVCPDYPQAKYRQIVKAAWARGHWRSSNPVKPEQRFALDQLRGCLDAAGKKKVAAYTQKRKVLFYRHREYRLIAPYPGLKGEGYWLRWLVVPAYVVRCEAPLWASSDGTRWTVRSFDGGLGPYQNTPWASGVPVPWPVHGWRDKMAHHRAARTILNSIGLTRGWVCA